MGSHSQELMGEAVEALNWLRKGVDGDVLQVAKN